jgi:hypothetical protein
MVLDKMGSAKNSFREPVEITYKAIRLLKKDCVPHTAGLIAIAGAVIPGTDRTKDSSYKQSWKSPSAPVTWSVVLSDYSPRCEKARDCID